MSPAPGVARAGGIRSCTSIPNCTFREKLMTVLRMRPNVVLSSRPPSGSRTSACWSGWSHRRGARATGCPAIRVRLTSDRSRLKLPGPTKPLRPVLPKSPAPAMEKFGALLGREVPRRGRPRRAPCLPSRRTPLQLAGRLDDVRERVRRREKTVNGRPLCTVMMPASCQPPMRRPTSPSMLPPIHLPGPNGSSVTKLRLERRGGDRSPTARSSDRDCRCRTACSTPTARCRSPTRVNAGSNERVSIDLASV